jgi:hypothetical protein
MDLKHTPKPLIEEHYHIQELIEGQEKRSSERARHRDIEKQRDEFVKGIEGFKDIETLDFYCVRCGVDFIARAKKQVDSWGEVAYYKTKHTCGCWAIRHITDRHKDMYFSKSKILQKQRVDQFSDTLQEYQEGFNMLYGKR